MFGIGIVELLIIIAPFVLLLFLIPVLLSWLWNITMPEVFGLKQITFWQAFRLFIIVFMLFGIWGIGGR
jgi:hypothetical protein